MPDHDYCQECGPKEREIALLEKMRADLTAMNDSLTKANLQVSQERDDLNLANERLDGLLRHALHRNHPNSDGCSACRDILAYLRERRP